MQLANRFYIVPTTDPNINDMINVSVGTFSDQRPSLSGTPKVLLKLHKGDTNQYPFFNGHTEYNDSSVLYAALVANNFIKSVP